MNATTSIPHRGPVAAPNLSPTPTSISTRNLFWNAFGHIETEVSAWWIVRFMAEKGEWVPFSNEDIEQFYNSHRSTTGTSFTFNRLVEPGRTWSIVTGESWEGGGWVVRGEDGLYRVTEDFVLRCHESAKKE